MKSIDSNGQYSKIDKSTVFKGSIKAETDIRIDGILEGDVETVGRVIIGKEASVKGKILCANADIEGVFKGNLTVSGTLSLKTGSNVEGEVFIQKLIVDSGAIFNANCSMHSEEDGVKKLTTTREKTA
ncbi:MAG: polymer-forming cytoskeletal protein [Flavobacteriia bacterium]|nr:polymer-forming cytoskeletal protein [Flavobacteriaceae bacterium]MDC3218284.1 polymer-forming cytoskeletal protein [Flavobacteriaceae bacterium]